MGFKQRDSEYWSLEPKSHLDLDLHARLNHKPWAYRSIGSICRLWHLHPANRGGRPGCRVCDCAACLPWIAARDFIRAEPVSFILPRRTLPQLASYSTTVVRPSFWSQTCHCECSQRVPSAGDCASQPAAPLPQTCPRRAARASQHGCTHYSRPAAAPAPAFSPALLFSQPSAILRLPRDSHRPRPRSRLRQQPPPSTTPIPPPQPPP